MPVHATALGQSAGESTLDVTARLTMAYAAGVEAEEACYLDDLRPDGVVAPPPFCVSLEWPVVSGSRQREITGTSPQEAGLELIRRCAAGDPLRLKRLAGRFHGMVIPGTTIGLEYGAQSGDPQKVQFTVTNAGGELAVSHGSAEFA